MGLPFRLLLIVTFLRLVVDAPVRSRDAEMTDAGRIRRILCLNGCPPTPQ